MLVVCDVVFTESARKILFLSRLLLGPEHVSKQVPCHICHMTTHHFSLLLLENSPDPSQHLTNAKLQSLCVFIELFCCSMASNLHVSPPNRKLL